MMAASGSSSKQELLREPNPRAENTEPEDRISNLPDEIRTKIVDLVTIKSALRTCTLSKSWRHILSSLTNLIFLESEFPNALDRSQRFGALIDWTLANHDDTDICSFVVKGDIARNPWQLVNNAWVTFAVQHNVKNLQLTGKLDDLDGLPSCVFTCKSLVFFELMVPDQMLKLPAVIFLPNLRKLILFRVIFPDNIITEKLFSGCPLLHSLHLRGCGMFLLTRLRISCPKLKYLCISYGIGIEKNDVYLQSPCIETFFYEGVLAKSFQLEDMSLISEASVELERGLADCRTDRALAPVALNLLRAVHRARRLTINLLFNQILPEVYPEFRRLKCFENLTYLCLTLSRTEVSEEVMLTMLSKFQLVQQLHIVICRQRGPTSWDYLQLLPDESPLDTILSNLRQLRIDNYEGLPLEKNLLRYFLQFNKSLTEIQIEIPWNLAPPTPNRRWTHTDNHNARNAIIRDLGELNYRFPTAVIVLV